MIFPDIVSTTSYLSNMSSCVSVIVHFQTVRGEEGDGEGECYLLLELIINE